MFLPGKKEIENMAITIRNSLPCGFLCPMSVSEGWVP